MILYFTGTGNSEYVAKRIAKGIDDDIINLFDKLKDKDNSEISSEKPFVIVSPTFAWELPQLVREWLSKTPLTGSKDIYFVLTCGSGIGGAGHYAKQLSESIGMNYKGIAKVVMPENYIAMFAAPDEEKSLKIIDKAEGKIDKIIESLNAGVKLTDEAGPFGVAFTKFMNWGFYNYYIEDTKFYVKDNCNGCGLCTRKCPKGNLELVDGKPKWKGDCTHCMACICYCPQEAIEYGKRSVGQPRYKCPKKCD